MSRIVESLLNLSRIENCEIRPRLVNLDLLVFDIIENSKFCKNSDALLVINPLGTIHTDPILLRQVFSNLLENAFKFSVHREIPKVEIASSLSIDEKHITIKDNGVGFDMAHYHHLFTEFRCLHSKCEFEGDGLGLAICKKSINKLGGRIWALSTLGVGSEFSFTLPYINQLEKAEFN